MKSVLVATALLAFSGCAAQAVYCCAPGDNDCEWAAKLKADRDVAPCTMDPGGMQCDYDAARASDDEFCAEQEAKIRADERAKVLRELKR
jgi:hypothetical protein